MVTSIIAILIIAFIFALSYAQGFLDGLYESIGCGGEGCGCLTIIFFGIAAIGAGIYAIISFLT